MASGHTVGAMQPDGTVAPEATFDVEHVASTIVHIASLPPDVTMLEVNIMYVLGTSHVQKTIENLTHYHQGSTGAICWKRLMDMECVRIGTPQIGYLNKSTFLFDIKETGINSVRIECSGRHDWSDSWSAMMVLQQNLMLLSPWAFSFPLVISARGQQV